MASLPKLIAGIIKVVLTPQILLMVTKVYIPVLFPLTFLIALSARSLDFVLAPWLLPVLGFDSGAGMFQSETRFVLAALSLSAGLLVVGASYSELVFVGEGSPSPTAGRTLKLVRSGIYAYSRNPSVIGKLLGVLSVGLVLDSFSFCFLLVPFLLTGSLIEKVVRQEPQLVEIFGDQYETYRREVPLFVPWGLLTFWRKK